LSGWPCIGDLGHSASSTTLINFIRQKFSEVGVPHKLITDVAPQFSGRKFRQFCKIWQIAYELSTPHFPQSNEWRNTPRFNGKSPSEIVYGRPMLSFVFAHSKTFSPKWTDLAKTLDKPKLIQNGDKLELFVPYELEILLTSKNQNRNYGNSRVLLLRLAFAEITT
ncbi:hypothetical protein TCAL_16058, partial [Tigriopus californicus]